MNQVLLVGEAVGWLEVDLIPFGMSCHSVPTATVAVEALKHGLSQQQPWHSIVVGATLPDMTGPAFVDGLLRHFDPAAVVLVADVEPHIAQHLTSSPKVRIFPGATGGGAIAEHLFRRLGGAPQAAAPPPPPMMHSGGGLAGLFDTAGGFSPPPPPPAQATPSSFPGASSGFGVAPNTASSWGGAAPQAPTATTMPFFAALGQQNGGSLPPTKSSSSQPPTSQPPMNQIGQPGQGPGADRAILHRLEALAEEVARANAEVASLKTRAQTAEARAFDAAQKAFEREAGNAALAAELGEVRTELDLVRHAARSEADNDQRRRAELEATQAQLRQLHAEAEPLRAAAAGLEQAVADLAGLQAAVQERDAALEDARRVVEQVSAQHHVDVTALNAHIVGLGEAIAAHEQNAAARDGQLSALTEQLTAAQAAHATALEHVGAELTAAVAARDADLAELESLRSGHAASVAEAEALKARLAAAVAEVEALQGQLAEAGASTGIELDALKASSTEVWEKLAAAETALAEAQARATALEAERAKLKSRAEAAALADLQIQALTEARDGLVDRAAAAESHVVELQQQLAAASSADADATIEALKASVTAAERYGALEASRAEKAVAEVASARQILEVATHEQTRLLAEMEQVRPLAAEVERARAAMVDMQRQLEAALGTDEADGDTGIAIQEAVRARTREILELARALEPMAWGLDQAAGFFGELTVDGAQRHVQSLRLLQRTIERMKTEVDRLHTA